MAGLLFPGQAASGAIFKGIPVENFVFQNGKPWIVFLLPWASNSVYLGMFQLHVSHSGVICRINFTQSADRAQNAPQAPIWVDFVHTFFEIGGHSEYPANVTRNCL